MKNHVPVVLAVFVLLSVLFVPVSRAGVFCSLNMAGKQPVDALYDTPNVRTFVSLFMGNEVLVLNHGCGIQRSLSTGDGPGGMAFDGTNLWVALYRSNAVEKINVSTGNGTLYPVGAGPRSVAFDGTYIWVTNENSNTVTKLLASSGATMATIAVGSHPWGVAVNDTNSQLRIWVANLNSNTISVLDQNGALQSTIPTASEPQFFASSTVYFGGGGLPGGDMYVSCYSSLRVERFSFQGTLIASYSTSGNGQPTSVTLSAIGTVVGVTHSAKVFSIANDGSILYEKVGFNNYGAAWDWNHTDTVWITDINEGTIFEYVL
jgi:YVTN family beta-propeller protein